VKLFLWGSAAFVAFMVTLSFAILASFGSNGNALAAGPVSVAGIPPAYLVLYRTAAEEHKIDWAILAAIGKIETDHGRIHGGSCATSSAGARGPMQFMPATWEGYGKGGNICDPEDAIPAAARYLVASGAPKNYRRAIFAYNHADWYVDKVLAQAEKYRKLAVIEETLGQAIPTAALRDVLTNPRIGLTPAQRSDLASGGIDPRVVSVMAWLARPGHSYTVSALRRDHRPGSNHEAGRAFDVSIVNGVVCANQTPSDPCGRQAIALARLKGSLRPNELISCFDPDNDKSTDPGGSWTIWAQADHCDHNHVGFDY
jgi:hypothetical protein